MTRRGRHSGDDPRTKMISIRLTEREYIEISEYAKRHDKSVTQTFLDGFGYLIEKEKDKR